MNKRFSGKKAKGPVAKMWSGMSDDEKSQFAEMDKEAKKLRLKHLLILCLKRSKKSIKRCIKNAKKCEETAITLSANLVNN